MGRHVDPNYRKTRVVLPTDVIVRASTGPVPTKT